MNKKYLLKGGLVGLIVTVVELIIIELSTKCSGYCLGSRLPEKTFFESAVIIYILYIFVGIIFGVILGWIIGRIKNK